jgi:DNA topoisomerase-1
MISAGIGRYGPFVLHDGTYANLETVEDVFSIGLNRAVTVIAEKKAKGPGGRGTAATLSELGEHPDGGKITVRDGRYGPYVNWGKINATLKKGQDPASVTQAEALELIAAKAASKGGKKKPAKAKAKPKARKSKE